ncbi:hypothetical protein JRI60_26930 [Archangium violaceum]|uniref:hypothetical protein n=1 Tax=Archangium violaceum TaxID=83451 RepID=UPI0019521E48|nr:hypothetical protein [Archangium violaceum]QRN92847.1 hypothetical protein JRI60_26930 [Archangium violaceum]
MGSTSCLLPSGSPGRTPAELAYLRTLQSHGRARSTLGDAVQNERAAWSALQRRLAENGPDSSACDAALRTWLAARSATRAAAERVANLDDMLAQCIREWAGERAASFRRVEAGHG